MKDNVLYIREMDEIDVEFKIHTNDVLREDNKPLKEDEKPTPKPSKSKSNPNPQNN